NAVFQTNSAHSQKFDPDRLKVDSAIHSYEIISPTALFLAAKVEEQPRKLEHVIKVAHACLHPLEPQMDTKSDVCLYRDLILFQSINQKRNLPVVSFSNEGLHAISSIVN
uniref:Uncharacterized protein n=1 Tax=Naja naja TaxID=35670 RepID=A0A8C6Y186_NAJNA